MALPPMRPRTMRNGTPRGLSASASFDSAAPTKPTGMPRMAAGFGAPASISSSSRNRAVGALPMATTAPARRSRHRSSAAAERVVPFFAASAAVRGSLSVQITSLLAGSRARVMPCATISASHRIGAPAASAPRAAATRLPPNTICRATSTWPQAWIMRTATSASSAEKRDRSASARMMANERSIDRRAVAQIGGAFRHDAASRSALARIARNRGRQFIGGTTANGASRAVPSATSAQPSGVPTTVSAARRGMRAALGAAGNMDGERAVELRRGSRGDMRRDGARGDMRRGANRRAGAGDDMPARIVGAHDKAEPFGGGGESERGRLA